MNIESGEHDIMTVAPETAFPSSSEIVPAIAGRITVLRGSAAEAGTSVTSRMLADPQKLTATRGPMGQNLCLICALLP